MRYHGNYCGPNWSAGKHQGSVVSDVPSVDEFDDTCKIHDAAYATGADLLDADIEFVRQNFGKGVKRTLAATAVGGQAAVRAVDKFIPKVYQSEKMTKLRGSKIEAPVGAKIKKERGNSEVSLPAIVGSVLRGSSANTTKKSDDSIMMDVQVCLGRPAASSQFVLPEMVAQQYLSPISVGNDEVQNMTRVYQHYRITKAAIEFRAFQGTSTGGEVIIVADSDPNYRPINTGTNSTFYQRALATKHSLLTPIWHSASMDLPVDSGWKVCDNANSTTLEEFCAGVIYVYSDGANSIPGYYLLHMKIEFQGLRFNSRNLISGSYLGLGTRVSLTSSGATTGADFLLTGSGFTVGDIYSVQHSITGTTFNAGTASTLVNLQSGTGTIAFTLTNSQLFYCRATSTTVLQCFTTYDAAVGSDVSDRLIYALTAAGTNTYPACIVTQLRNSAQPTL